MFPQGSMLERGVSEWRGGGGGGGRLWVHPVGGQLCPAHDCHRLRAMREVVRAERDTSS